MKSRLRILMAEQEPPLSQAVLIDRLGLGSHTISRLYNNTFQRIDTETVEKLCDFFECGLAELFELKEQSNENS